MAGLRFELRAPESGRAGGTVRPGWGKMLPGSPCDPGPHFSFLPSVLSTQEAWRGPPLPIPSAAGWTRGPGVTGCPPLRASHFLSCVRRGVPGMKGQAALAEGWTGEDGPLGQGQCPWLPPAGLAKLPPLPPPPLFPQSSGSLEQEAGGPRRSDPAISPLNRRGLGVGPQGEGPQPPRQGQ